MYWSRFFIGQYFDFCVRGTIHSMSLRQRGRKYPDPGCLLAHDQQPDFWLAHVDDRGERGRRYLHTGLCKFTISHPLPQNRLYINRGPLFQPFHPKFFPSPTLPTTHTKQPSSSFGIIPTRGLGLQYHSSQHQSTSTCVFYSLSLYSFPTSIQSSTYSIYFTIRIHFISFEPSSPLAFMLQHWPNSSISPPTRLQFPSFPFYILNGVISS